MTPWELTEAVLAAIVTDWSAEPLPDRQYPFVGTPAHDCPQLVVALDRTFGTEGNPGREGLIPGSSGAPFLRTAALSAELMRCATSLQEDGSPAPAATLQAEAAIVAADAQELLARIVGAYRAKALGNCSGLALENWRSVGPNGGLAGGKLGLRINLF